MTPRREQFAQRRKSMGYTQESLAALLRVDRTTVIRWERGTTEPQPWIRRRLAQALDTSLDQLDALLTLFTAKRPTGPSAELPATIGGGAVNRRSFTALTAIAGLGLLTSSESEEPHRLSVELDKGWHADDLSFLSFLTAQEAQSLEGLSYVALSQPGRAIAAFRAAAETPDSAHPRNTIQRQINLADAERSHGDLGAAGKSAFAALPGALALDSARTSRQLKRLRDDLAPHRAVAEIRAFVDAYDERFAAA